MGNIRIMEAIMGYLIPFALLIAGLFMLEIFIELLAGTLSLMFNWVTTAIFGVSLALDTSPDFPGPLNLLNFAIGSFPSIYDIGTTLFFGLMEEISFLLYIVFTVLSGFLSWSAFIKAKDSFRSISDYAGEKAGRRTRMESYDKIIKD